MKGRKDFPHNPYAGASQFLRLPPERRKTFVYETPHETHFRKVTCKEAAAIGECDHYAKGFAIPVPLGELETITAKFRELGYHFMVGDAPVHLVSTQPEGTKWLVFPPEQRCLNSYKVPHRVNLHHDPLLSVRGGDFRMFTGEVQEFTNADDWVESLQTTTQRLHDEIEKG